MCLGVRNQIRHFVLLPFHKVILNFINTPNMIGPIIAKMPKLKFVQSHYAGVDHLLVPELVNSDIILCNAKGLYASPLAEFALMGCAYFAKDLPRLLRQKQEKNWEKYVVQELRGAVMGIIGSVKLLLAYSRFGWACLTHGYGVHRISPLFAGTEALDELVVC